MSPLETTHGRRPPETTALERSYRALIAKAIRVRAEHARVAKPQAVIRALYGELGEAHRKCITTQLATMLATELELVNDLILIFEEE